MIIIFNPKFSFHMLRIGLGKEIIQVMWIVLAKRAQICFGAENSSNCIQHVEFAYVLVEAFQFHFRWSTVPVKRHNIYIVQSFVRLINFGLILLCLQKLHRSNTTIEHDAFFSPALLFPVLRFLMVLCLPHVHH
jgi:hypothetical protein